MSKKLVVTRHKGLVLYLKQIGLIDEETETISHADISDVKGKHVFGILPYWLASHADMVTEIQLRIPKHKMGQDLTVEEVKMFAKTPRTYIVREVKNNYITGEENG